MIVKSKPAQAPNLEMPRPVWMSQQGGPLYDEWAKAVLAVAEDTALWASHLRNVEARSSGIVDGAVLDPEYVFRPLFHKDTGLIRAADEKEGISERLLLPRIDEILHYTSAKVFMKKGFSEEQSVAVHAQDSLRFAMAIAIGLVHDVFVEHTYSARDMLNRLFAISDDPSQPAVCDAIREIVGPLWDTSLEERDMERDPWALLRVFELQNLTFVKRSLGNATLQACLEDFSVTGFDVLGDQCTILGSKLIETPKTGEERVLKSKVHGWMYRGHHFGLQKNFRPSRPKAVLAYDASTDTFEAQPGIIKNLHNALRRQNRHGLKASSLKSAGNIRHLKPPLSEGCPVHWLGSIALATNFGATVFERMIAYHQEHPLR